MRNRGWTTEQLRQAAQTATSYRGILQRLGLKAAGGNYTQLKRYLAEHDISPQLKGKGWSKGLRGIGKPRKALSEILIKGSAFQSFKLKKRLFSAGLKEPSCEECGWAKSAPDGRIPLELDHINGNADDNRLDNLRILCPNCHSLKPTHRGLNQRRHRIK